MLYFMLARTIAIGLILVVAIILAIIGLTIEEKEKTIKKKFKIFKF